MKGSTDMIAAILRVYSYIYHLLLALALLGLAGVAKSSGLPLRLEMLPWTPAVAAVWVMGLALLGLLAILLAVSGKARWLFLLYALGVLFLMAKGYFLSGYGFANPEELYFAAYLSLGALVAAIGAALKKRRDR
jgi:hypothetical protein